MTTRSGSRSLPASPSWLSRLVGHARSPSRLPLKLRHVARRWLAGARYRKAFARGEYLVESGPPGDAAITVAMPVYRVREEHLRAAIASVTAQTHPRWELVLCDDASPEPHVARVLDAVSRDDPRVRVLRRPTNGGIAAASDDAIAAARCEFVAFLDHDDTLHPRALEMVARQLRATPDADWLFTDEDKIDEEGVHSDPCFKPCWSRHLLLAFNYVAHLRVARRAMLARVGGHRRGLDGAQDYDLALRVLAAGGRFVHLPGVLYHWRSVPGSMARAAADKPAAHRHALRALAEHAGTFPRGGAVTAEIAIGPGSIFKVRRAPDPSLRVESSPTTAPADLVRLARSSKADIIAVGGLERLDQATTSDAIALLQVPGTAVAGPRLAWRGRVASSGWAVADDRTLFDPWLGLAGSDPGYLNLATMPGRRLVAPPGGWLAWRDMLVEAWEKAPDVTDDARLWLGLDRLGLEVVVAPSAVAVGRPGCTAPSWNVPEGPVVWQTRWLEQLGVADWQRRAPRGERR